MTGSLLDVCLALLLISAAAGTLVDADTSPDPAVESVDSHASDVAMILATTTAPVEYSLAAPAGTGDTADTDASPETARVAHAALAEHLARAATRSATIDGTSLSATGGNYRRGVRRTVADAVGAKTAIRAVWRPLPCVELGGTVRIGLRPPPTASVRAARFSVPVGISSHKTPHPADARPESGIIASRTVGVLFPPERVAAAIRGDPAASAAMTERYRRAGEATGVDAVTILERAGPRAANRALATALDAETMPSTTGDGSRSDLVGSRSDRDGCPTGDPNRVTVVVRTWSP